MSKMTNEEVKAFWLKHGKKPRVQICRSLANAYCVWETFTYSDPTFQRESTYRIHPDDLAEYTTPRRKLDVTKPLQYASNKDLQVVFLSEMTMADGSKRLLFKITTPAGADSLMQTDLDGDGPFGRVVNPLQQRSVEWRAVYINGADRPHGSLESAKRNAVMPHLGFIKITTFTDDTFTVEKVEAAS